MKKQEYKELMSSYRLALNTLLFTMNTDPSNINYYFDLIKEVNAKYEIDRYRPKGYDKYNPIFCGAWIVKTAIEKKNLPAQRAFELADMIARNIEHPYPIDKPSKIKNYRFYKLLLNNFHYKIG